MKESKLIDSANLKLYIETLEPEGGNMVKESRLKPEIRVEAEVQDGLYSRFLAKNMIDGNSFIWYSPIDPEGFVDSARELIPSEGLNEIETVEEGKPFHNSYDSFEDLEEGKNLWQRLRDSYSAVPLEKQDPEEIVVLMGDEEACAKYGWELENNGQERGSNKISLFTSKNYERDSPYEEILDDFLVESVPENEYRTTIIYNLSQILEEAELQ